MKILRFIYHNILFLISIFLLVFIPLYPKIPLLDVKGTWVYIRVEDFVIAFVVVLWTILLFQKKISLKTPLTLPIFLFWIIGAISVLHGVMIIFPTLSDVFPNVAFLSMLRRIEYLFLFFVAFSSMKSKNFIYYVIALLAVVLVAVVGYGVGQKFLGFPAYLTSNEEFAKGVAIQLSELSRVPSTFAGHYDLAAYLVLIVPIIFSVAFVVRHLLAKALLFATATLGFGLLSMTVSRVSFFVLLLSLVLLLVFQKRKLVIISLFALVVVFLIFSPQLLSRFGSTISDADVLVNAKTGHAIGNIIEVDNKYFEGKIVLRDFSQEEDAKLATSSAIVPMSVIPEKAILLMEPNEPTGENLPQGTAYVNLELSPVTKKINQYFYKKAKEDTAGTSATIYMLYGDFLIKRAKAYDLSFATRFQGEWPKTIRAFTRNIFLGSGYGSVTLAVDNNYLRILGETGILGFIAFISIFIVSGIYIKKILPLVSSSVVRGFALGFAAGTFGLFLNAFLIDVFEASKIAFTYWLLMGITIGILTLYKKDEINLFEEFKRVIVSTYAIIAYLFFAVMALFVGTLGNYFVGDDFTWFRWISNCCTNVGGVVGFFTDADGFFYRPGTKSYFYLMHSVFWLNQNVYHLVSIFLHFAVAALGFMVSQRIFRNYFLSAVTAFAFIILSGHHEAIFWISTTGFLFNAVFALLSLLMFIYWKERKKTIYFVLSILFIGFSLLFHELGVIAPLLIILYDSVFGEKFALVKLFKKTYFLILTLSLLPYFFLRLIAKSHWFSGDYSYNIFLLPFNFIGNAIGYLFLSLVGTSSLPLYNILRDFSRENLIITFGIAILIIIIGSVTYKILFRRLDESEKKIVVFGLLFFAISLLPFLGLGNITSRYSYLSSFGFTIILVFFFKKLYCYLLEGYGRQIAILSVLFIGILFCVVQLFQLQKIHIDWETAGEKSKSFIVSLEEMYINEWRTKPMDFYFVNVPIRFGEAWVFPVGLPDLVWFVTRNENINIYQVATVPQAFDTVGKNVEKRVFEFDSKGGLTEWDQTSSGEILEVDR